VNLSGWRFKPMEASAMSARKSINVTRTYKHEPDQCVSAVALLLNTFLRARKEAARPAAPNEAKGPRHARPARTILPR
jgi:hypothetical protein